MVDVIIIGKGPAGVSASLYTSRANLNTLIIGKTGALGKSSRIDNYYGFRDGIAGEELLKNGEAQTLRFGTRIIEDEVISLEYEFDEEYFIVKTRNSSFESKAVLLATGSERKSIRIKDIDKFTGRGIHYCTTCDGYFYRNKKVGMLGYTEYALNEVLEMKQFTDNITLLTNGNALDGTVEGLPVNNKKIISVNGDEYLKNVEYDDGTLESFDGIFVAYGTASSVDFARKLGIVLNGDIIEVDGSQSTNLKGLYAAGDCCSKIKQIAVAVGQGAAAGLNILEYIRKTRR